MASVIQWSKDAQRAAGVGSTPDSTGRLLASTTGYHDQAFQVGRNPSHYGIADVVKAANILHDIGAHDTAQRCVADLQYRSAEAPAQ